MDSHENSSQDLKNQRGQLTLFLGIALFLVITFIAFVINVGLFVKAKINLQNATDAAAWAGAAVQARQLSNIAYVNYHFRQIFKKWMFKYYILGHVGGLANPPAGTGGIQGLLARKDGDITNFRSYSIPPSTAVDKYNLPSICIHKDSPNCTNGRCPNLCAITSIPGLPRFESQHVFDLSKQQKAFIDQMVDAKNKDCSQRTKMNFDTAIAWAYGNSYNNDPNDPANVTVVAADELGAWPEALLTAVRMRNLEAIVNRSPVEGICTPPARSTSTTCTTDIEALQDALTHMPYNERPVKAFLAGYRNLGGGYKKELLTGDTDELAINFELTELTPQSIQVDPTQLSGYLIPPNGNHADGNGNSPYSEKYYLDLQMIPVNYAVFYSAFFAKADTSGTTSPVPSDATCDKMKLAIPVPAYIMGFIKNNRVMTYYAVKAKTKFMGLFFPFFRNAQDGIELQAYAAAKPFGGRIGPWLFKPDTDGKRVLLRHIAKSAARSAPYAVGLTLNTTGSFEAGDPMPNKNDFYLSSGSNVVGGIPDPGNPDLEYAIPNMFYDSEGPVNRPSLGFLELRPTAVDPSANEDPVGLYEWKQYHSFVENTLGTSIPSSLFTADINDAVKKSQIPTRYEAANWMIPLRTDGDMEAPSTAAAPPGSGYDIDNQYLLYAPLSGPGTLYTQPQAIIKVVEKYLKDNEDSLDIFLNALRDAAEKIIDSGSSGNSSLADREQYENSADRIFPLDSNPPGSRDPIALNRNSLATRCDSAGQPVPSMAVSFYHLLKDKEDIGCEVPPRPGITPILAKLRTMISSMTPDQQEFLIAYYVTPATPRPHDKPNILSSAYFPGPSHGTENPPSNKFRILFPGSTSQPAMNVKRNYYSTKFIHTRKLFRDAPNAKHYGLVGNLLQEKRKSSPGSFEGNGDIDDLVLLNALPPAELSEWIDKGIEIRH